MSEPIPIRAYPTVEDLLSAAELRARRWRRFKRAAFQIALAFVLGCVVACGMVLPWALAFHWLTERLP